MAHDRSNWSDRLAAWQTSGKTGAAWCRDNGIGYYQFQYWRDKLRRTKPGASVGQFVPLTIVAPPLRLECNGVLLHVASGFDPNLLREVISVLRDV